jgi:hypothetical protein
MARQGQGGFPSDRTISFGFVIASEAKQSRAAERSLIWIAASLRSSQ